MLEVKCNSSWWAGVITGCGDGPPGSGRFSVSALSLGRSSGGLPSARWSQPMTSGLARAGSAEAGSGAAEEASGWVGGPAPGLQAGGWCWPPGRQGL